MLIYRDSEFCPPSNYPIYPPYASGAYLEDYFTMRYRSEFLESDFTRKLIQVIWTPYYIDRSINKDSKIDQSETLQVYLDSLPRNEKYFIVCQHDDAPLHRLPEDTIIFSAGGNHSSQNVVPIPLVVSKIPKNIVPDFENRDIFVSFIGSETHPIRGAAIRSIENKNRVVVNSRGWTNNVPQGDLERFVEVTKRSEFCLCPRGYGKTSFRMYEAMQLGAIPVYVSDSHYLPWTDELDWSEFCVLIDEADVANTYEILKSISEEKKQAMREKLIEVYDKYFTLNGVYDNIIKRVRSL